MTYAYVTLNSVFFSRDLREVDGRLVRSYQYTTTVKESLEQFRSGAYDREFTTYSLLVNLQPKILIGLAAVSSLPV